MLSVGGLFGATLVASSTASAADSPTLTASATDALHGGQTIQLSATGHDANSTATILQCSSLSGPSGCDLTNIVTAPTDATGAFTNISFKLASGAVGDGFCPGKTAGSQCYLVATTNPADPTKAAVLPIKFAPIVTATPAANLKNGDVVTVSGYGFPAKAQSVTVLQCANPPGAASCNIPGFVAGTTTANGTFDGVKVTIKTGAIGSGKCDASNACLMIASTDASGADPNQSGTAALTFAADSTPGPTPGTTPAATKLSLSAKAKGNKLTLRGAITSANKGVSGLTVKVYQRAKGSKKWKLLATIPSNRNGSYVLKGLPHKRKTQQYRAKHALETVGDRQYSASASKVVTVKKKS